ncbi:Helix-turn-helix domain protein [Xylophilus ampelinus]|nr:Helix-turn-helix domain protein [Xylophilus ampelinus]
MRVQEARIIAALRVRPQTTDSFRAIGIFQISARIWGLRKQGWNIQTNRITVVDRDGYAHPRAALYSLIEEVKA